MTALTFTADSGTDQLTIVGHGLSTGNGAGQVSNVGGGLPGGLTAATDYFIIRIDADHVQLASSVTNAVYGTAINITTNGTGVHTLTIGMPNARERTYVFGSQVFSADLDKFQDHVTAHTRRTFTRPVVPFICLSTAGTWVQALATAGGHPVLKCTTAGANNAFFAIPFEEGDRLVGFRFEAYGTGSPNITTAQVQWAPGMGTALSAIANLTGGPTVPAAWTTILVGSPGTFTPKILGPNDTLYFFLSTGAANLEIGELVPIFDRLS